MTDVFISYSRKDIAFARLLHQALKENQLEKKRDKRLINRMKQLIEKEMQIYFWSENRVKILDNYSMNDKKSISPYNLSEKLLKELKLK